jgi:apolipoprotein N-acyltransferase
MPIDADWTDAEFNDQMTDVHITLTERAMEPSAKRSNGSSSNGGAEKEKIDLVIWPESPASFDYERDPGLRRKLADFVSRHQVFLLFDGWGFAREGDDPASVYNSAMMIGPSGERISRYDKIALMPFGEYVPARGWIPFMDRVPALVADITPGNSPTLSEAAGTKLGTFICFEATRPEIARAFRNEGAQFFAQLSNESWFGPTAASRQVMAQAVFRAVENDVELVRATNSGHSARIDRYGAVHNETPMFQTATRLWKVEAADGEKTFYTRYGDVFVWLCAALSASILIAACIPKREEE